MTDTPAPEWEIGPDLLDQAATEAAANEVSLEPGWWVCEQPCERQGWATPMAEPGDLFYLASAAYGEVKAIHGESTWTVPEADWLRCFRPEPQGQEMRQQQLLALMAGIDATAREVQEAAREAASAAPAIAEGGGLDGETALAVTGRVLATSKKQVALVRNAAEHLTIQVEEKTKHLAAFAREQALIATARLEQMKAIAAKAEEAVWALNLYLGTDEAIVTLREGEPAPADAPLTVRQRVLYMDEESVLAAEAGGIDAQEIEDFDRWVLARPEHLDQLLPEPRGVVALRPRRKKKDYSDAWLDLAMADANKKTYLLVRNGECLYRLWTTYEARDVLMPGETEFGGYFPSGVKPGSPKWMRAMDQAAADKQHYMRFFLLLRGLLDRTDVFAPMEPFDLSDPWAWGTRLVVLRDQTKALDDGHERFAAWLARVNAKLDVGHRVVGAWNSKEGLAKYADKDHEGRRGKRPNERLDPPTVGVYPDTDEIHTIAGRRGTGFYFLYDRGTRYGYKTVGRYKEWGQWPYETRARCTIYPDDGFFLDLDAADLESMQYFVRSRFDRPNYEKMIPLLGAAIKAKVAEREEEAPFREALVGALMREHGAAHADAEAAIDDLILWYKTKNRHHRALLDDGAKAVRLIVEEYGRRQRERGDYRHAEATGLVDWVLALAAEAGHDVLLVGHREGREYRALLAENQGNVWVREEVIRAADGAFASLESRRWRLVDARHQSWRVLYTGARWAGWDRKARASLHLTDPEIDALIERAWSQVLGYYEARRRRLAAPAGGGWNDSSEPEREAARAGADDPPVWMEWVRKREDGADVLQVYYRLPAWVRLERHSRTYTCGEYVVRWKRTAKGVQPEEPGYYGFDTNRVYSPQRGTFVGTASWRTGTVIKRNPAGFALADREHAEAAAVERAESAEREWRRGIAIALDKAYREAEHAAAYQKYLDDFGDPPLWPRREKKLALPQSIPGRQLDVIDYALDHGIPIDGRTLGAVLAEVEAAGFHQQERDFYDRATRKDYAFPERALALVIQAPPKPDPATVPTEQEREENTRAFFDQLDAQARARARAAAEEADDDDTDA